MDDWLYWAAFLALAAFAPVIAKALDVRRARGERKTRRASDT